ncbi:MAG TPA: cysteine hydrolase [Ilumatobacteraceae bacterium]|nr:cysteine hydrolase [Ilumatobacteraceae bacterium]
MRFERLRGLVAPATTAVLTMELQAGIVGEGVLLPALRDECVAAGTIANAATVCAAARRVGARVVHCTIEQRGDDIGFVMNSKLSALAAKQRGSQGHWATEFGTPGAGLVPELDAQPGDLVMARLHGMSPFMSTSLDQVLRNLGVSTVVATGVSVNVGVFGLVLNAVDLGYQVVVVRDAVAGVPADYADAVIDNSLSMLATIVTTDELVDVWAG